MTPEDAYLDDARAWLKALLTDRKQASSESTARSLASQFRRVAREAENEALERAARICEEVGRSAGPDERDEYANGWADAMTTAAERIHSLAHPSAKEGGK